MVVQLKTYVIWLFFMSWPNEGHENWSALKFIGLVLTGIAVF